jgi:hypothetical protein
MDHAAVAPVVCFGTPHPKLREEVPAAVVLRESAQASERDLQVFVATRAAELKVPKKIRFMDEITKGATGKLQRIGLAAKLSLPRGRSRSVFRFHLPESYKPPFRRSVIAAPPPAQLVHAVLPCDFPMNLGDNMSCFAPRKTGAALSRNQAL